jgi:carbon storage regulator CsrA
MLVLSQKRGASIVLAGGVTVKVLNIRRRRVWIGITAPKDIKIRREPGPASSTRGS